MLIAGAVLFVIAVVLIAASVSGNGQSVKFDLWGVVHANMSVGAVFIMGLVTTIIAVAGFVLLTRGLKDARARRKEERRQAKEQRKLGKSSETSGSLGVKTPDLSKSGDVDFTKPLDLSRFDKDK
jgi:uncharacterized membrane protein YciS (DUF1049 family)